MNVLVVVDMQNDFVSGALGTAEAVGIVPHVVGRVVDGINRGEQVFFTRDTHEENYMDTQEGHKLPVPHCIRGTAGWEIIDQLREDTAGREIIDKPTFGSMALGEYAIEGAYDEIELVGLVSNICVMTNAAILKTALPEATVTVNAALTASHDAEMNRKALDVLEGIQVNVINR